MSAALWVENVQYRPLNRAGTSSLRRRYLVVLTAAGMLTAGLATTPAAQPANAATTTLGSTFTGASNADEYGHDTALSQDGTRMIVGAPGDDSAGNDAGLAQIFDWDGTNWNQIGGDLTFGNAGDRFGHAVDITRDGQTVVIGAPNANSSDGAAATYTWDGSAWNQNGGTIDGAHTGGEFGTAVAISDDGNWIAVGAPQAHSGGGEVEVWTWDETTWSQLGDIFDGSGDDNLGASVALSANGHILAFGAPGHGTTGTVHFQQWQGSTWVGGSGGRDGDFEGFGASIDFSATGRYIVIGSPDRTNDDDTLAGQVTILKSDGSGNWPQVGADINGAAGDNLGTSVAISDDGQRVVIGSPNDDTNGTNTGTVRVLDWNGSAWTDAETPLNGDTNNERLGAAVSLSGNGDTITASAIPDGTTAPGQVTVHNSDTNPVDPGRPLKLDFQTTYSETGPIQYVGPSCATFADGIARCWGTRTDPWTGRANTNEIPPLEVDLELDAGVTPTSVAVGEYHACFVLRTATFCASLTPSATAASTSLKTAAEEPSPSTARP